MRALPCSLPSLLLCLALFASVAPQALTAPDEAPPGTTLIRLTTRPYIELGMSRDMVQEMFGAPSEMLSAEAWVYFDFRGFTLDGASLYAAPGRDALVIVFARDRVSRLRLCDSRPIRAFLAQQTTARAAAQNRLKTTTVAVAP